MGWVVSCRLQLGTLMFEEFLCLSQILPFLCYKILYGGLYNIFIGFMEVQVNLDGGSRWSPDSLLKKYPNSVLTVATDSVVEKVRIQLYCIVPVLLVMMKI